MRFTLATSIVALAVLAAAAPQPVVTKIGKAIPITKRSQLVNADKTVNVEALKAHAASVKAKILRGFANFERTTGSKHPADLTEVQKRGGGDPLTDGNNNELWYGSISVGTPAVTYTVDFDTGSSDLFLPGSSCDSTCDGHTPYDPSSSSTSQDVGQTFTLRYGDGSTVSGEQYTDTVSIAGFTASDQTLGAADTYSTGFQSSQFPADGLMGMGFQSISSFEASPVFQSLVSAGQVDSVFSFKLASSGSELYLGGTNSALYTGSIAWTPVTKQGYWQVNMDSIEGHGKKFSNIDAIIDTGTTLIYGTPSQVSQLSTTLGGTAAPSDIGSGFFTFPCNSFPSISLTFGGQSFPISQDALNLGPVSTGSSDCVSGLVGQDVGSSFWIVGDVFLRNTYTVFDVGNTRVGFAKLA